MTTENAETRENNGVALNINYSSLIFIVFLTGLTGYFSTGRMASKKCINPGRKVMRRLGTLV